MQLYSTIILKLFKLCEMNKSHVEKKRHVCKVNNRAPGIHSMNVNYGLQILVIGYMYRYWPACMCIYSVPMWCPQKSDESTKCPGSEIKDSRQLSCGY